MNKKVNLFLIGAPKCGTTSLANYLANHTNIFLPKVKEPHYFAVKHLLPPTDDYVKSISDYNDLYNNYLDDKITYWLDASVWYYSKEEIAKEIYTYNPDAKILLILRNPFDAVISLFQHKAMALKEDCIDINEAIKLENSRRNGENIPSKMSKTAQGLLYRENYIYTSKMKAYIDIFGEDNVKVLLFDDLLENKEKLLKEICDFLEIAYTFSDNELTKVYNKSIVKRDYRINKLIKLVPKWIKRPGSKFFRNHIDKLIEKNEPYINSYYNEETITYLSELFIEDISKLEKVLNRNLNSWKRKSIQD